MLFSKGFCVCERRAIHKKPLLDYLKLETCPQANQRERGSAQVWSTSVSARIPIMLDEHVIEPHFEPAPCKYCGEKTICFCRDCNAYVCEERECLKKHAKEYGFGLAN